MIFCHCRVVTDRAVADAIGEGAGTVAQLSRATGAGQDCGRCVFSLKRLLCQHGAADPVAPMLEVDVAAS
jgi:bacterioferritin-associated ferredoxin